MDMYVNIYVSEAAIAQIVAVRYYIVQTCFLTRVLPFWFLDCVVKCAVFPYTPAHTLRPLLLYFFLVSLPPNYI